MKSIRFRISRLMIVIGVIAFNIAACRTLLASRKFDILLGGALLWLVFQVGVFLAVRGVGHRRSFWLGFLAFGSIGASTYLASWQFPQSLIWRIWRGYFVRVDGVVSPIIAASFKRHGRPDLHELLEVGMLTLTWCLPILLLALAGGLLARRWTGEARKAEPARVSSIA